MEDSTRKAPHEYPPRNRTFYLAIASICICSFMSSIDTVIVASSLPRIAQALHATSVEAYWCGTGFLFAQTVSQPIYGAFTSVVGMKVSILAAVGVFLVASVFCAAAQNIAWLIAARVVQGCGAGGINALVNVTVSAMTPLSERGKFLSMVTMCAAVGLVSGVVLGGAIAERTTWRLVFYINIPICTIAIIGLVCFLHFPGPKRRWYAQLQQVDWIGLVVLSGSLTGILYGITGGNVLYPWSSPRIITAIVAGCCGIVVFILFEHCGASNPLLPLRIFASRTAASGYYTSFVHALILWAMAYYLILFFVIAKQHTLLGAAVAVLPGIAVVPPFAAVGGVLMAVTKRFQPFNLVAWIFMAAGVGAFATLTRSSPSAAAYGFQALLAIGGGIIFPGRIFAAQAPQTEDDDVPIATTMVSFFTSLGQAFGLGIGGTIFQNRWTEMVHQQVLAGTIPQKYVIPARDVESVALELASFPVEVQVAYQTVVSGSLRVLWITLAALSATAFLATLAQRNLSLSRPQQQQESDSDQEMVLQESSPAHEHITNK